MAKMTSKKGLFFTISIVFLIPAIITLWTLSTMHTKMEESMIVDRIYDLSGSVEFGIRDIFYYYSCNITMEKTNNTINITFIENISANRAAWNSEFNTMIGNFRSFIESQENAVKLNVTLLQQKDNPYVIEPYNITYYKNWSSSAGGNLSIRVVPNKINFKSYDIEVNTSNVTIGNVTTQYGTAGAFAFTVTAVDNYGHKIIRKSNVDPSNRHQVQIFFNGSRKINITVINNNLEIWTNLQNSTLISTKLDGFNRTYETARVKIFKDAINVSFPAFKAEKIDSVYIFEKE